MIISVTNRLLCKGNFLERIEKIAKAAPHSIILREKDLRDEKYEKLAAECLEICTMHGVPLVINSNIAIAEKLKIPDIHLSTELFKENCGRLGAFKNVGVSVHSPEEAIMAEKFGAAYLIAGHIFQTDCKKGMPPKGLDFLRQVCEAVSIPVAAIGGISELNAESVLRTGAKGICVMSGLMACEEPENKIYKYKMLLDRKY
jgi:thiamine-phosphate pyrophosphorylase